MLDIIHGRHQLQGNLHMVLLLEFLRGLHQIRIQLLIGVPERQLLRLRLLSGQGRLPLLLVIAPGHLHHLGKHKQDHKDGRRSAVNLMSHEISFLTEISFQLSDSLL